MKFAGSLLGLAGASDHGGRILFFVVLGDVIGQRDS